MMGELLCEHTEIPRKNSLEIASVVHPIILAMLMGTQSQADQPSKQNSPREEFEYVKCKM